LRSVLDLIDNEWSGVEAEEESRIALGKITSVEVIERDSSAAWLGHSLQHRRLSDLTGSRHEKDRKRVREPPDVLCESSRQVNHRQIFGRSGTDSVLDDFPSRGEGGVAARATASMRRAETPRPGSHLSRRKTPQDFQKESGLLRPNPREPDAKRARYNALPNI
jgi:hypothetical protein